MNKKDNLQKRGTQQPFGNIVLVSWVIAMLMLVCYAAFTIFNFNFLNFEVIVIITVFFNTILLLVCLSWILQFRNRQLEMFDKFDETIKTIKESIEKMG